MNKIKSNLKNLGDFASWREIVPFFQESLDLLANWLGTVIIGGLVKGPHLFCISRKM